MTDLYKWINIVSKNFEFQPDEAVQIDREYGGGVGRFVRLGIDGSTALVDMKGNILEFPLDNIDRVVTGEENIYDEPETHQYSDFEADAGVHELNDKPEILPGKMVEIDGAFGAGNGKGHGVFMGYSLDGATALVNIDSQIKSFRVEMVSVSSAVEDAEEFASTGNDGALSPLSFGDENKLIASDEDAITIEIEVSDENNHQDYENTGDDNMRNEEKSMDELLSIIDRGNGDEEIVEAAAKCCDACKGTDCDGECCDDCKHSGEVEECNEGACTCKSYDCSICFPIDLSGINEKWNFEKDDDSDDDSDDDDSDDDSDGEEVDECNEDVADAPAEALTESIIGGMASIPDMTNRTPLGNEEDWYQNFMKLSEGDGEFDELDGDISGHASDAELGIGELPEPTMRDVPDEDDDEIFRLMVELDQSDESKWELEDLLGYHAKGHDAMIRKWHARAFDSDSDSDSDLDEPSL